MKRLGATLVLVGAVLVAVASTASAKGNPQGPVKQAWLCFLDLGTWHCVPPGEDADAVLAGERASAPSLNFECDEPGDPLCEGLAVSLGPPEETHFVGTENLIRADLFAGQPCPQGTHGPVDFDGDGEPEYFFCHHYAAP